MKKGGNYLIRSKWGISKCFCLDETEKCYKVKWELGDTEWILKSDFESDILIEKRFTIIECLKNNIDKADVKCCFCIHFQNDDFDNKRFGYCQKLFNEIYTEDKDGNILKDKKVVTNADFGCTLFERNHEQAKTTEK